MVFLHPWNSILFLLTAVRTSGSTVSGNEKDIMHAIAGNPIIIRTWPMLGSNVLITVKKDNITILDNSVDVCIVRNSTVQNGRMMLICNQTIHILYLLIENVTREDEGIYEMKESFYPNNIISDETEYDRKDGTWYLYIYVLGQAEIKHSYVGENISMEFELENSIEQSSLYNYDEQVANLNMSACNVVTVSSLHGRLRCEANDSSNKYAITIVNVTQRDYGLYKVAKGGDGTGRCFLSIADSPIGAVVGENITIGWFYNQQGIKRTLRVIHPKHGIMMLLNQTNLTHIRNNFQHRLLYKGDILQSLMSFTLLNVEQSDAGLYTIETRFGNVIPGSKELHVDGTYTTRGCKQTTVDDVTANLSDTKQEVVTVQLMERQSNVLVDVNYMVIGLMGLMIIMIGYLIWMKMNERHGLKAVERLILEISSSTLNYAPFKERTQLETSIVDEEGQCRIMRCTPVGNAQSVLKFCSNQDNSLAFDTPYNFAKALPILEADKPGLTCKNIVASKEFNEISIQTLSYTSDNNLHGLLEDCQTVCILGSAASNEAVNLSHPDQVSYAKVKKGPRSTFTNNKHFAVSSLPDGECSDGYEMVNFTLGNQPRKMFHNLEIVSESAIPVNLSLQEKDTTRNNYARGSKDDDGYETSVTMEHMTMIKHGKVSEKEGAMTGKDQEPSNYMIPRCAMHSDYADIAI